MPDNGTEGAELACEVVAELVASAASLSVRGSLLSSLSKAAVFMVKKGIAMNEGQVFKLALNIEVGVPLCWSHTLPFTLPFTPPSSGAAHACSGGPC